MNIQTHLKNNNTNANLSSSILESFSSALPDFLSLYGAAAICKESALLPMLKPAKDSEFIFEIYGDLKGILSVEAVNKLSFSSDILKEAINIVLGQTMTQLQKFNINCMLGTAITSNSNTLNKINFRVKYSIESLKLKDELILSFQLREDF